MGSAPPILSDTTGYRQTQAGVRDAQHGGRICRSTEADGRQVPVPNTIKGDVRVGYSTALDSSEILIIGKARPTLDMEARMDVPDFGTWAAALTDEVLHPEETGFGIPLRNSGGRVLIRRSS